MTTTPEFILDSSLKLWHDKIIESYKRKDLTAADLASLFQQQDLQQAFFKIIDRDCNDCLSFEEWTGCFSKLLGDTNDTQLLNWFVEKFYSFSSQSKNNFLIQNDFVQIVSDIEFGYRLASLISPNSRRIKTIQMITSLEIIASLSTDAKWLSWLKYQFTEAMNKNNRLDKNELHVTIEDFIQNFNFKEPFLAQRLFTYLDKDRSGFLSLREFINGLEVVVNGSKEAKIEFLFKVFDVDGNGHIDFDELRMMLKCCLDDSPSLDVEETVDDLATLLFKYLDKDDSGDISLDELRSCFKEHHDLYKSLTVCTSIWIKPKFVSNTNKHNMFKRSLRHFFQNKQPTLIFWSAYLVINIACMITAYFQYENETIYIRIARMCGNSLNFNCSLILVLVLRKHLTWLRIKGGSKFLPLDESIEIHKKVGCIILILSSVHAIVHLIHLYIYDSNKSIQLFLTYMFTFKDNIGYPTGVIQFTLLIVILIFASSYVRKRGHFELFYLMHMLTIPWLFIMLMHGFRAFWKWVLIPAVCYAIETILRYRKIRSNKFGDTFIMESYVLPSKVVHLVIRKPSHFEFKPGDYIFLNIPIIAKYEWHPFSISSAPENSEYIWLHIKAAGNWTNKLYEYSQSSKFDNNNMSNILSSSQRSITRVNMRSKMSNLLNRTINDEDNDANNDEKRESNNNIIKKVVSFVPTNDEKQEQKVDQIDLSKIESSKEVLFFNLNENTPRQEQGLSLVPQQENKQQQQQLKSSEFKETANVQLRHKSILKAMSLNCYSLNEQSLNNNNNNDHPTESTPRSLNNVEDEESKTLTSQLQHQQSAFRNRSKSLDHATDETDNSFLKAATSSSQFKSESNDKLANSDKYQMRLNYTQTENNTHNISDTYIADENKSKTATINETNNYSKNNLILSFENNLTSVTSATVEFSSSNKQRPLSTGSENVCFLNMVDTSDESGSSNSNGGVVVSGGIQNEHSVKVNSFLDNKPFNNLNKSITSLYNRLKQQVNASTQQVMPSIKRDDTLGYLKLYQKANKVNINSIGLDDAWRLKVHIDGPYGTPSSDIFHSEHAVLVAAGIGITPFASILQSLMNQFRQQRAKCPQCDHKLSDDILNCGNKKLTIKKVDFIWVTREQRSLEWFISILSKMEMEQKKNDETFLETHLYVTSAKRQSDLRSVGLQITLDAIFSQEESSLIDGLRKRTHHGRPNWDIVLQNLIRKQKGKINVFYCGLPSLANILEEKCDEYNLTFKKEIF